jgi:outer membrane lipoprotein-sorting protein
MLKKVIGILLAVILALSLTAACGKKTTTPFTITSSSPTTGFTAHVPVGTPTPQTTALATTILPTSYPTTSSEPTPTITRPSTNTTRPITAAAPTTSGESLDAILGRGQTISSLRFDMKITSNSPNEPPFTGKVYMKGTKYRMEMTAEGQTMIILVDAIARTSILIMGSIGMSQTYSEDDTPMGEAEDIMGLSPVVVGTEILDGKLCTVITYTEMQSGATVNAKIWIWNDYGLPLKAEITSGGKTSTILYENIDINPNLEDALFQVPPGVTIMSGFPTVLPTGFPGM